MGCGSRAGNAVDVRVMRQPRGGRVGKGLRSGGRAGNVATVRVMRRSRGERGSCAGNVTVRGQRVSVRWAREDMRAQQREGERESMGRFAFVARLRTGGGQGIEMLVSLPRHVASCHRNVSHETFSIMENNGKGFVRGGRGAWHRARQDAPGRQVPCACERWVAHARMGFGCSDAKGRARGLGWGLRMRARGLVV